MNEHTNIFAIEIRIILLPLSDVSHVLIASNYKVCLDDAFDLWLVYFSGERVGVSWPSCSLVVQCQTVMPWPGKV